MPNRARQERRRGGAVDGPAVTGGREREPQRDEAEHEIAPVEDQRIAPREARDENERQKGREPRVPARRERERHDARDGPDRRDHPPLAGQAQERRSIGVARREVGSRQDAGIGEERGQVREQLPEPVEEQEPEQDAK